MRPVRALTALLAVSTLSTAFLAGAAGVANAGTNSALLAIIPITEFKCLAAVKGHADVAAVEPDNLTVRLFGADEPDDSELVQEGPFSTARTGDFSARFSVNCALLDEDQGPDEIFAVASVFDPATGVTRDIRSNTVSGIF